MLINLNPFLRSFLSSCRCINTAKCKRMLTSSKWLKEKCHYKTLGLQRGATKKEIRLAYLQKTKLCHPDSNLEDETLHARFVEVAKAYSVLGNENEKRKYDSGDFSKPNASDSGNFSSKPNAYKYRHARHSKSNTYSYNYTNPNSWDEETRRRVYEELNKFYTRREWSQEAVRRRKKMNLMFVLSVILGMGMCHFLFLLFFSVQKTRYLDQKSERPI